MSPSSIFESPKGRRIREINNQLINQFHPAVKNVAVAGQNLARIYESEGRAFHAYAVALLALAHSGEGAADARSRRHAEHIRRTVQTLERIHAEQTRWVEYFAKLSIITSQNYETEKERLKNNFNSYSKKEKTLFKTLLKTKHTRFDMEDFYEEELSAVSDQQTQRYRFFAERHDELLRRSRECAAATVRLAANRDDSTQVEGPSAVEEESDNRDARSFSDRRRSFELASTEKILDEWRRQASLDQCHLDELYAHAEAEQKQLDLQDEQKNTSTETELLARRRLGSKPSQSSAGSSTHPDDPADGSSTASKGIEGQPESQTKYRKRTDDKNETRATVKDEEQNASQSCENLTDSEAAVRRARSISVPSRRPADGSQRRQHYRSTAEGDSEGDSSPAPCDDGEREEEELYAANRAYTRSVSQNGTAGMPARQPLQLTQDNEADRMPHNIYEEKQRFLEASERLASRRHDTKPPVVGATATPILAILQHQRESETFGVPRPDYPNASSDGGRAESSASFEDYLHAQIQRHVEHKKSDPNLHKSREALGETPLTSPSVTQPPIFDIVDHGKVLECLISYEACGDNQLTLDVGDRVVLVKSGTRGWVLGRTEDGTRQGWYPAKFLRIA